MHTLVVDTETSAKKNGEMIEVAMAWLPTAMDLAGEFTLIPPALGVIKGEVMRFKPTRPMTMGSLAVHHILPSELENYPDPSTFKLPPDTGYIIGHSVDYDWEAMGRPSVKRICTHAMAQHVFPDATGYSLVALIYMLLGPTESTRELVQKAHGAVADVYMCVELLDAILKRNPQLRSWSELWQFSEDCRIPITAPLKRWEGVKLTDMDDSSIDWCLRQDWLDPYFRVGLERVMEQRYPENNDPMFAEVN